jgi:hypothetical protein
MRIVVSIVLLCAVLIGLFLVDRKHAQVLRATGVDRFGDWHQSRRWVLRNLLFAALAAIFYLMQNEGERAVGPVLLFGGAALVAHRASRRGERHDQLFGRGA